MSRYRYSLGKWNDRLERKAHRSVNGQYFETAEAMRDQQVSADEVEPNTAVYDADDPE